MSYLGHWAQATYLLVEPDEIHGIGETARRKWGPVVEVETLRALGQAALRVHHVSSLIEPAMHRIEAGPNGLIRSAGQKANETQDPEQL